MSQSSEPPSAKQFLRMQVWYSGRVQGVGFRWNVARLASERRVTGIVENLPDGRVHLVAEGTADEIAALLESIEQAMRRYIGGIARSEGEATGEWSDFTIRR